jgi:magnesium-transporting ATPase (P-type)
MYFVLSILFAVLSVIPFSSDQIDDNDKPVKKALFNSTNFVLILFTLIVYSIECASFIVLASQFFKKSTKFYAGIIFST